MNLDLFSPYIRVAMNSFLVAPFKLSERIIFDFEIIFIESGRWRLTVCGKEYICEKNSVLFIPPGTPHIIESIGDICVSQPHIHFDVIYDKLSPLVYVSFKNKDKMSEEERLMIRDNVLDLPFPILKVQDLVQFKSLFFDIISCFKAKNSLYRLECKAKMLLLLKFLLSENAVAAPARQSTVSIVKSVKNYIDYNYHNIITLDILEKQFSYNKCYISRMFTQVYHIPIMKYYQTLRAKKAKEYLQSGLSVTEASGRLNFSSIYSFSRFFKNSVGMTPSDFKKAALQKSFSDDIRA